MFSGFRSVCVKLFSCRNPTIVKSYLATYSIKFKGNPVLGFFLNKSYKLGPSF